jgi:hypothetical protein
VALLTLAINVDDLFRTIARAVREWLHLNNASRRRPETSSTRRQTSAPQAANAVRQHSRTRMNARAVRFALLPVPTASGRVGQLRRR